MVVAACYYACHAGKGINQLKHGGQLVWVAPLAKLLLLRLNVLWNNGLIEPVQAIVPVPQALTSRLTRGFNQAEVIAHELSRHCGIPVIELFVARSKTPQQGLNRQQRLNNLRQVFELKESPTLKHIAIIDDVYTTGATSQALANLLKPYAVECQVWVLARTQTKSALQEHSRCE
ncbi:hypothetical protein GCM10007894_14660 [Paraferrimonas haliotis]|uniref:ComF family protein n=2 Tax=Paraferrimonas haliotis TaxID=2013866 RepID=A0AA37TLP8_9GAMM|nr:hypothetical protein GCM10007894_14660 [Paraferrimonas haliotis]